MHNKKYSLLAFLLTAGLTVSVHAMDDYQKNLNINDMLHLITKKSKKSDCSNSVLKEIITTVIPSDNINEGLSMKLVIKEIDLLEQNLKLLHSNQQQDKIYYRLMITLFLALIPAILLIEPDHQENLLVHSERDWTN